MSSKKENFKKITKSDFETKLAERFENLQGKKVRKAGVLQTDYFSGEVKIGTWGASKVKCWMSIPEPKDEVPTFVTRVGTPVVLEFLRETTDATGKLVKVFKEVVSGRKREYWDTVVHRYVQPQTT